MHKAMRRAAMASAQSYGLGHSQPTGATKLGNNARKNSMAHKWASMVRIHHLRHHVLIQQRGGNWWRRQWAHWRELVLALASCEQGLY